MNARYDAIVIGSGYGGGVAACRLARMGRTVAVLERGREWPVGTFPTSGIELTKTFQARSAKISMGSETALFDYRIGDDVDVLVGCGLGGTSLINANVCLKPDPRVFEDPSWPEDLRHDGTLAQGYARARAALQPKSTPVENELTKLEALDHSAATLGTVARRIPVHVSFSATENFAGVQQPACTLCGDCCGGCNVGAKSTTVQTYLSDAVRRGASIFTHCNVRTVQRSDNGWRVSMLVGDDRETKELSASIVVLAAGTLGSTEIMLRSRDAGLAVSERLGQGFTANGDCLAVAYNGEVPVNNVGTGHPTRKDIEPVGPAVAGLIDQRADRPLDEGIAIVEAALPSSMAGLLPTMLASGALPFGTDTDSGFSDAFGELRRSLESVVGGAYTGAVRNSQTLLGIGHDQANGRLVLDNDRIQVHWPNAGAQPVFARLFEAFESAARGLGASLVRNPFSLPALGNKVTTVHPLGGCRMGDDCSLGVVDHRCRVFDGAANSNTSSVHEGLFICDGAVMVRSLGIHPLFTITAIAERAMIHLSAELRYKSTAHRSEKVPA